MQFVFLNIGGNFLLVFFSIWLIIISCIFSGSILFHTPPLSNSKPITINNIAMNIYYSSALQIVDYCKHFDVKRETSRITDTRTGT